MKLGLADTGGEVARGLETITLDLTMGVAEGTGVAVDDLAMGTLERTVDGMRVTGAVVEEATGEAVQKVRPV